MQAFGLSANPYADLVGLALNTLTVVLFRVTSFLLPLSCCLLWLLFINAKPKTPNP